MAARVYSLVMNFCMYCATKTNENTMSFCCKRHPNLSHDATCLQKVARRLVMAVAVCLVAITWPTSAAASCGNYLFRHGKPVDKPLSLMTEHHDVQNHVGEKNKASNELPAPPCHGPNCSGNRIPLIPVPVAPSNLIRGFDRPQFWSLSPKRRRLGVRLRSQLQTEEPSLWPRLSFVRQWREASSESPVAL